MGCSDSIYNCLPKPDDAQYYEDWKAEGCKKEANPPDSCF